MINFALRNIHPKPTAEELADVLWLAAQMWLADPPAIAPETAPTDTTSTTTSTPSQPEKTAQQPPSAPEIQAQTPQKSEESPLSPPDIQTQTRQSKKHSFSTSDTTPQTYPLYPHTDRQTGLQKISGRPFKTPAATMLPGALNLGRALRPLMRQVASRKRYILNEEATVQRIAENCLWLPVLQGAPERWFEMALVIDRSNSMVIWQPTIAELRVLLERHGAFRKVRIWNMVSNAETGQIRLHADTSTISKSSQPHSPRELIDPSKRRLIWVVSDCVSPPWYKGTVFPLLKRWGEHHPVAIVQMLPQLLWSGSALGEAAMVKLRATAPGLANAQLTLRDDDDKFWFDDDEFWFDEEEEPTDTVDEKKPPKSIKMPIVTLEPESFALWARLVMGQRDAWMPGVKFYANKQPSSYTAEESRSAQQRVDDFYATASPMAQRLAGYLATVPLTLPVMRLVQQVMLPESLQVHLAEVFLGGLLKRISSPKSNPFLRLYDFHEGVRELLLDFVLLPDIVQIIVNKKVSKYVERELGKTLDFQALLADPKATGSIEINEDNRYFAAIGAKVLRRLGGDYKRLAAQINKKIDSFSDESDSQPIWTVFQSRREQAQAAESRYLQNGDLDALDEAVSAWESILGHPNFNDAEMDLRLSVLNNSGINYIFRYQASGVLEDLNHAIACWEKVVEQIPAESFELPMYLNNLGKGLRSLYEHTGRLEDLQRAIELFEQALQITPSYADYLNNLGNGLHKLYEHTGRFEDLQRAIRLFEQAVQITPPAAPDFPDYLNSLGNGLRNLYERTGDIKYLERAIAVLEQTWQQTAQDLHSLPSHLNNLGKSLHVRYKHTGNVNDLQNAIKTFQKAVELTPDNSPDFPRFINSLGNGFTDRYAHTGNVMDLEQGIEAFQKAVQLTPNNSPNLPSCLNSLGTGLRARYARMGNLTDLEQSIEAFQKAVQLTPDDSPDLPKYLNNLGTGLRTRYAGTGKINDLQQGLEAFQQAVKLTPDNSPDLPSRLNNLGNGFSNRYARTGEVSDLEQGIEAFQQAVKLIPENSPDLPRFLNNMGTGLRTRYAHTGEINDLQQGLEAYQQAVKLTPENSPDLPRFLNSLGNGLTDRYARTGQINDLQQGIEAFQQAIRLTPENSPDLPRFLNSLGNGLTDYYARTGQINDLQMGIEACQQAVKLTPENSPDLPRFLNNLGTGLRTRYARTGEFNNLQQGIEAFQQAVRLTPENSPDLPRFLNSLGNGLTDRYARTGEINDLQQGREAFQWAAQKGLEVALEAGLKSASNWLRWAFDRQAWSEVVQAYELALQTGTRLVQVQLLREHQEFWLKETQGLAAHTAYALAQMNQLTEAAVTLERGLAFLLSEALALDRADLEHLKAIGHADLYNRYQQAVTDWHQAQQSKQIHIRLRAVREELDKTIAAIRKIDGYVDFLTAPDFADILAAVKDTVLVYIVTTTAGGLTLIVYNSGKVTPVWLPELTEARLQQTLDSMKKTPSGYLRAYFDWRNKPNEETARTRWFYTLEETTHWLWQTVMAPLIKALPEQAKITLIPVSRLGLLPLHAAWIADATTPTGKRYALDALTITYAPNARAIIAARQIAERIIPDTLLAIEEPLPVTASRLPHAPYETQTVISTFSQYKVLKHTDATRAAILEELPNYDTLHFSCHGIADLDEPLNSGLLIADNQRLTVKDLLELRLNGVRLATLSACETGIPGIQLPDEVVHLASGLLQAGVGGIIASLWSISELSTMMLITYFYDLWRGKQLEPVEALRQAQIWMRDTTNTDKKAYFKQVLAKSDNSKMAPETAKQLMKFMLFLESEERGFEHPFHWATFEYVGV